MLKQLLAICRKELLDALRDSKSLSTALLMPVIFAALTFAMFHFFASMQNQSRDFKLAVKNGQAAAPLMQLLREQGIDISAAPADPFAAVRSKQIEIALEVSENFAEQFRRQQPAQLDLIYDHSSNALQAKVNRLKFIIGQWEAQLGALRLITRNVSPSIAHPVKLNEINTASDQRVAAKILGSLPMFFVMIVFASGIGMASDMAAGERERKSLEPLLINPVSQATVFFGKWGAGVAVTLLVTVLGTALQFLAVAQAPLADIGLRVELGAAQFALIIPLLLPLAFLACALQLFVSLFAKSFKDAQTYNGLVILLPMLPGLYLTFNAGSAETWQMLVPVLGQQAILVDIISGDALALGHLALASATALLWAGVLAAASVLVLRREKTLFG